MSLKRPAAGGESCKQDSFLCLEKSGLFYAHFYGRRYQPWLTELWVLLSRSAEIPPNYKEAMQEKLAELLADGRISQEKYDAITSGEAKPMFQGAKLRDFKG